MTYNIRLHHLYYTWDHTGKHMMKVVIKFKWKPYIRYRCVSVCVYLSVIFCKEPYSNANAMWKWHAAYLQIQSIANKATITGNLIICSVHNSIYGHIKFEIQHNIMVSVNVHIRGDEIEIDHSNKTIKLLTAIKSVGQWSFGLAIFFSPKNYWFCKLIFYIIGWR